MKTYEQLIEEASGIIAEHNEMVEPEDRIDIEAFFKRLKGEGGTSVESLKSVSFEDLESMGLPKLIARQVAKVFRSDRAESRKPIITAARADTMTGKELLAHYDPTNPTNAVGKRLAELSKGEPCLIFTDGNVNAEASAVLIDEINRGFPARTSYMVENRPQQIYRVGERPDQMADENPLYPGRILRPDGACDQTNRSWAGVPEEVRALMYLALTVTRELKVDCLDDAQNALDLCVAENAAQKIRQRYPQASIKYDELAVRGSLPSLKRPLSQGSAGAGSNQPFLKRNKTY